MKVAEVMAAKPPLALGTSDWITVTQSRIDEFAESTGDFQWIHVDRARAARGPFGGTIAHGFLTLSMIAAFGETVLELDDSVVAINYGLDRVRFLAPVPVDSRVRGTAELVAMTHGIDATDLTVRWVVDLENHHKPACVADHRIRLLR